MSDAYPDDPAECLVDTPFGQEEALVIIDRDDGMVRLTAVSDNTTSVMIHSPSDARRLAEELIVLADCAEEGGRR
jgi:ABC-type nitrate/sulfonate/bicarbonate transport system ATPase subunit